jgi:hypothetical protein
MTDAPAPPAVYADAYTRNAMHDGCRFPLWPHDAPPDHRYCGAPVLVRVMKGEERRSSYCATHAALCYVAAKYPLMVVAG